MPERTTMANLPLPAIAPRVRGGRRLALARACGVPGTPCSAASPRRLRVHDALAGWGTDGLVLAALGCAVHMSERHPEIYRRLLARLREHGCDGRPASPQPRAAKPGVAPWRITAALEDARQRWRQGPVFDVIYLDPMFGRHPKTAAPSRHMRLLAELAPALEDVGPLIELARGVAGDRVVVKRRRSAKAHGAPAWQIAAKTVRFDVYRPRVAEQRGPPG